MLFSAHCTHTPLCIFLLIPFPFTPILSVSPSPLLKSETKSSLIFSAAPYELKVGTHEDLDEYSLLLHFRACLRTRFRDIPLQSWQESRIFLNDFVEIDSFECCTSNHHCTYHESANKMHDARCVSHVIHPVKSFSKPLKSTARFERFFTFYY